MDYRQTREELHRQNSGIILPDDFNTERPSGTCITRMARELRKYRKWLREQQQEGDDLSDSTDCE